MIKIERDGNMTSDVSGFELTDAATAKEAKATRRGIPFQTVMEKDCNAGEKEKGSNLHRNSRTVRYDILRSILSSLLLRMLSIRAKKVCSQAHNLTLRNVKRRVK